MKFIQASITYNFNFLSRKQTGILSFPSLRLKALFTINYPLAVLFAFCLLPFSSSYFVLVNASSSSIIPLLPINKVLR